MMTPERWKQVKEIFHSALEREQGQRPAFLANACGDDEALRQEVESLISSHEKDDSFIDSAAFEAIRSEPALRCGQMVSHYKIISTLGKGGMGEVYLAEDTNLGRKVALKFLPSDFTSNRERLDRFEQEARAASSLNHPNIITIYEIGKIDALTFMVAEFIDGETLRQKILAGPLPVDEALSIAEQIASALAAAHVAHLIHRDIKPENVIVRRDNYVKVLDFGLVKLAGGSEVDSEVASRRLVKTSAGLVMGTAAYMSPEQARGFQVDQRTDIWSLGVVLYEMLSGRAPFEGETTSDILVSILEREPPSWAGLSPQIPDTLEWIVTKALTKYREGRYQTATELLTDLRRLKQRIDQAALGASSRGVEPRANSNSTHPQRTTEFGDGTPEVVPGRTHFRGTADWVKRHRLSAVVASVVLITALIGIMLALQRLMGRKMDSPETITILKTTQLTFSTGLDQFPSLSPDGNSIAYSSDQNGSFEIYVKQLTPGGRDIPLTSDGQLNLQPAWSPDGQHVAYFSQNRGGVWIVPALGGTPKQLVEFGSCPAWSHDGTLIAFQSGSTREVGTTRAMAPSTIWIVSFPGGRPRQITQQGEPSGGHASPAWSPDGRHIAFQTGDYGSNAIWQISVATGELTKIADMGGDPIYAPNGSEIYITGGRTGSTLSVVRLSSTDRKPIGEPMVMTSSGATSGMGKPTISADGKKIAYAVSRTSSTLWSILLSDKSTSVPSPFMRDTSSRNLFPRFSHDGRKVTLAKIRPGSGSDIWVADADGSNPRELTANSGFNYKPDWFPQDDRVAFLSEREGRNTTYWSVSLATGKEERLLDLGESAAFAALSPDGKQVAFNSNKSGTINMWTMALGGGEARQLTFSEKDRMGFPCWSRDGKFLAFLAQHGGDGYLMVMPAGGGTSTQLTFEGQSFVYSWSPDGNRLAFAGERNGTWNVYWVARDTKEQKQLTNYTKLNAFVRYPEWSPLGNQIVYEYAETSGNIWLLELK